MKDTAIEWTDHTWSPWRGCTKVSAGCANCYAEGLAKRFGPGWGGWGKGAKRVPAKDWNEPVRWNKDEPVRWNNAAPSRWEHATFRSPMVFPSLCDWLDEEVPVDLLARFLSLIHDTPHLTWQLLTKRPEAWRSRMIDARISTLNKDVFRWLGDWIDGASPTNVWVGTSVEVQIRAEERIPALWQIPAHLRFLSIEPMLGPIDLTRQIYPISPDGRPCWPTSEAMLFGIYWVIVGGESGPGARPCNVDWVRSVVRQCAAVAVPCFVKQLGSRPVLNEHPRPPLGDGFKTKHPKGGDPEEWPEDLRVRQMPEGMR